MYEKDLFNKLRTTFENKKFEFINWIFENYSESYERLTINTLSKLWKLKPNSLEEFNQLIKENKINGKSVTVSIRVYCNFLEKHSLLIDENLKFLRKNIKIIRSRGVDSFVPSKKEVDNSIQIIKENYSEEYLTLYQFLIESGCRFSELMNFILTFDNKHIEEFDKVITYRNFFIRGQKSSYYLFFKKDTYEQLIEIKDTLTKYQLERFKDRISRNKEVISVKYLRKYNFTFLIENGISFEIANFIQGRTSQNIGFNHYLAKKVVAVKEYKKLIS